LRAEYLQFGQGKIGILSPLIAWGQFKMVFEVLKKEVVFKDVELGSLYNGSIGVDRCI